MDDADRKTLADGAAGRAPPARTADAADTTAIGRFAIRRKLGEGGMGVVYAGHDAQLDREVAIKLVRAVAGDDQARARLLREAQAMAQVAHPNVVPIYEVGEHGDQVFVAMELVAGETLTAWLRREPRDWRAMLAMFVAAGRGLAAAHARGLVHRDFKPDNVLVGGDGRPRVLDFGLARAVASPEVADAGAPRGSTSALDLELTVAGSMMGTPGYMSPEHFAGRDIGPASDQFGFAVGVYRALFDHAPFAGASLGELRDAVCSGALQPPRDDGSVPASIIAAVLRALASDPAARFPTMDALLDELEKPLRADPARDRARGRAGRRAAAALISALALVGVAVASAIDVTPGWLLVQSLVMCWIFGAIGAVALRRGRASAHDRDIIALVLTTVAGFAVHRAAALVVGSRVIDSVVADAVLFGVATVIGGMLLERWMLLGAPLALAYIAVAAAAPVVAVPAFGAVVLVFAAIGVLRWGAPARPWRKR